MKIHEFEIEESKHDFWAEQEYLRNMCNASSKKTFSEILAWFESFLCNQKNMKITKFAEESVIREMAETIKELITMYGKAQDSEQKQNCENTIRVAYNLLCIDTL